MAAKAELAALDAAPLERRHWIDQQRVLMRDHPELLRQMVENYQESEPMLQRAEQQVRHSAEQRLQRARSNLCRIAQVECDSGAVASPAAPAEVPAAEVQEGRGSDAPPPPVQHRPAVMSMDPPPSDEPPGGGSPLYQGRRYLDCDAWRAAGIQMPPDSPCMRMEAPPSLPPADPPTSETPETPHDDGGELQL